jgi:Thiolase, N-terminal domain
MGLRNADWRPVGEHRPVRLPGRWVARVHSRLTVNRACGSSQQAIEFAAMGVMSGRYDVVVAGGVESMTRVPLVRHGHRDREAGR